LNANEYSDAIDMADEVEELLDIQDDPVYELAIRDMLAVLYIHGIIIPVRIER
jgi:hypothetical protein